MQTLLEALAAQGEKTAVGALKKTSRDCWSFRKLGDKTRAFANGLAKAGFKRGDSVALFAENRLEWIAAALGAIRAGAVAVPLDVQLSDDDLAHILDDSMRALSSRLQAVPRTSRNCIRKAGRV